MFATAVSPQGLFVCLSNVSHVLIAGDIYFPQTVVTTTAGWLPGNILRIRKAVVDTGNICLVTVSKFMNFTAFALPVVSLSTSDNAAVWEASERVVKVTFKQVGSISA